MKIAASPRDSYPVTGLPDGRVLYLSWPDIRTGVIRAWLYDPRTDAFGEVASPPWRNVIDASTVTTAEGWCVMTGGAHDSRTSARVVLYEPEQDSWFEMPPMPAPRRHHKLCLAGGRVYAMSEYEDLERKSDFWSWAPGELWRELPTLPIAAREHELQATELDDGSLAFWSSRDDRDLFRWSGTWSSIGRIDIYAAVLSTSDGLWAIGGVRQGHGPHPDINAWTPAGWTRVGELPDARAAARAIRLADGRAVVICGLKESPLGCDTLYLQSPGGWLTIPTPERFSRPGSFIHALPDGRLLVVGEGAFIWSPPL